MGTLWRRLAAEGAFADCSLLADTAKELEKGCAFTEALQQAARRAAAAGLLDKMGEALLLEFAAGCGRVGLTQQAAHMAACQEQLRHLTQEADRLATARAQVYQMLGVSGGVGLSLLLL